MPKNKRANKTKPIALYMERLVMTFKAIKRKNNTAKGKAANQNRCWKPKTSCVPPRINAKAKASVFHPWKIPNTNMPKAGKK